MFICVLVVISFWICLFKISSIIDNLDIVKKSKFTMEKLKKENLLLINQNIDLKYKIKMYEYKETMFKKDKFYLWDKKFFNSKIEILKSRNKYYEDINSLINLKLEYYRMLENNNQFTDTKKK